MKDHIARIGVIQVPVEPGVRENVRDLGREYPDRTALGLDATIVVKQPVDPAASDALDWAVAFSLSVLLGSDRYQVIKGMAASGDVLKTLARFANGYIRFSWAESRIPLHAWPFTWGPIWRLSRQPLTGEVGAAIADAVEAATKDGMDINRPSAMTVGVPLAPTSSVWSIQELPQKALQDAAKRLGWPAWSPNIQVIWSSLYTQVHADNHYVPIAAGLLWPSVHNPDPLIQDVLDEPSLLLSQPAPVDASGDDGVDRPPDPVAAALSPSANGTSAEPVPDKRF